MEIDPFNVRNVLSRLVYDSYMGILRISPNALDDNENYLEDDATVKLSSLEDSKKNTRQLQLTDSDGNDLGIYFIPMAFPTKLYGKSSESGLINITTKAKNVFVTNVMTVRSTLKVGDASELNARRSDLIICTRGNNIDLHLWLLYPTESPNDNSYFNNKNKLNLFSPKLPESRYELVRKNLLLLSPEWYENPGPILRDEADNPIIGDDGYIMYSSEGSKPFDYKNDFAWIGDNVILTKNENEEPVPIVLTRDYVLGNYDGHSFELKEDIIRVEDLRDRDTNWIGDIISDNINISNSTNDLITKLSWLRLDNLVWQSINEVLSGTVRYYDGEFRNVGYNVVTDEKGGYNIQTTSLNGNGGSDRDLFFSKDGGEAKLDLTNAAKNSTYGFLSENGLLLGQDVAPGLIMYNAMPVHRLLFHVLRLRATNLYEEERYGGKSRDGWRANISDYVNNGLITKYSIFNESFTNNLSKNFILCDGRLVNYDNYPSLNTNNKNLFKQIEGGLRVQRDENGCPNALDTLNGIYDYLKYTPNLLSINEKSPRLIRGANWTAGDMYSYDPENISGVDDITFGTNQPTVNTAVYDHLQSTEFKLESIALNYPINELYKVYLYNYNVNPKNAHNHNTFISGGQVPESSKLWMYPSMSTTTCGGEVFMNGKMDNPEYDNDDIKIINSFSSNETPNTYCGISNKLVPVGMLWLDRIGFVKNSNDTGMVHVDLTALSRYKIYIDNVNDNGGPTGTSIKYSDLIGENGTVSSDDRLWWLMKASEQEGSYSITERGGYRCNFNNVYFTKCGKDRHLKICHNHKQQWNYPIVNGGAGAYLIGAAHSYGDTLNGSENERGISSLPYESVKYLGGSVTVNRPWNDVDQKRSEVNGMGRHIHNSMTRWERYFINKNIHYGEDEIEIDVMMPQTPTITLVPLMRI